MVISAHIKTCNITSVSEETHPDNEPRAASSRNIDLGDYEFQRSRENFLGKGGFGSVWRGQKVQGNTAVTIKELHLDASTKSPELIKREADILKTAPHHRNIVAFLATASLDFVAYFVLEYCIFGDLHRYFREQTRVSFQSRLQFM